MVGRPVAFHEKKVTLGDLATVVVLLILVYVNAKPTVNRWATVKFLRTVYEASIYDLSGPIVPLATCSREV